MKQKTVEIWGFLLSLQIFFWDCRSWMLPSGIRNASWKNLKNPCQHVKYKFWVLTPSISCNISTSPDLLLRPLRSGKHYCFIILWKYLFFTHSYSIPLLSPQFYSIYCPVQYHFFPWIPLWLSFFDSANNWSLIFVLSTAHDYRENKNENKRVLALKFSD